MRKEDYLGESRFELESLGVLDPLAFSVDAFASVPIWSEQKGHPNLVAYQVSPFPRIYWFFIVFVNSKPAGFSLQMLKKHLRMLFHW